MSNHPCHSDELKNLNRILGQVEGVKKMIGEQRYCPDIMMQIRAARAALKRIEANILERHLNNCVQKAANGKNQRETEKKLSEISKLFRRFDD